MNEITKLVAEELNKRLDGKLEWDETCKIFRITTKEVFVCVKDHDSDWYNYGSLGIGENLVCADSIEMFDKWSSCVYAENHPMMNDCFDTMVKNIERLAHPLYKKMANMWYMQLNNDDMEEVFQIAYNLERQKFVKDIIRARESI